MSTHQGGEAAGGSAAGDSPWPTRLLALLVVVATVGHGVWLRRVRAGGPLDIDEAAYLTLAFQTSSPDHRIVTGPLLLWRDSGYVAPLLPAVTGALHHVFGRSVTVSHLSNLVFFALLVVVTYLLARRFTTGWWALLAATVVATAPAVVDYSRHYHFALASTALFSACLLALVRSEGLTVRRWSLGFGVGLGLLLLARTVMIAFAPGVFVAAVVVVVCSPPSRRRTATRHLLAAGALAAAIAGSWYVFSAPEVWDYLTDFGYGAESTTYGEASVWSARYWLADPAAVVSDGFYLPLAAVLAVGAVLGALTRDRAGTRRRLVAFLRTDAGPVVVALAAGWLALVSSRNEGTGFVLPLLPPVVVLAVALIARARPRPVAVTVACVLVAVCLFNTVMKADVVDGLHEERAVDVAGRARLRVVDGRSIVDRYVVGPTGYSDERLGEGWDTAAQELLGLAREHTPAGREKPDVLLTVEGPLFNAPALQLEVQRDDPPRINVGALDRALVDEVRAAAQTEGGGVDVLTEFLAGQRDAGVDQVVTGPGSLSWDRQRVPEGVTTAAAVAAGYQPVGAVALPDGTLVVLWSL